MHKNGPNTMIPNLGSKSGVVRVKIDPLRCSVGGEGVRSFPPAKAEGAPHRVNLELCPVS